MRRFICSLLAIAATSFVGTYDLRPLHAADLTIGDKAPALDIEHWVHAKSDEQKVTAFKTGKVYVVEFWATWCPPCIASMPHLAELQKEYQDRGVTIVSVSDEDLQTVNEFLKRPVPEAAQKDKKLTYAMLTKAYSLTTDPDQSTYEDYMVAAAQDGIPTAFLVGKDAKIEWIGHPMEIDEPLKAVLADKWDRKAFAEKVRLEQEEKRAMNQIYALLGENKIKAALSKVDALIAKGSSQVNELRLLKLQIALTQNPSESGEAAEKIFASLKSPAEVDMIAWNIWQMIETGALPEQVSTKKLYSVALKYCEAKRKELKDPEEQASMLDTTAHLLASLGQLDKAIELEEQALKLATGDNVTFMKEYLAELKEEKANQDKK